MRPIAEQAEEKGVPMEKLLGKTVEAIRILGFEVPDHVPRCSVLQREGSAPNVVVETHAFGRTTGYIWHELTLAEEIDREVLGELLDFSDRVKSEP